MQVEFLFDFASPNAYLAHKVIPGIEARTGARFVYKPVLLGGIFKETGNKAPMVQFAQVPSKLAYERLEFKRFIARHKIGAFVMNPHFPVNSVLMMRIATALDMDGGLAPCVEAAFHHMWEAPKKMDDPEVVRAALAESSLDADRLLARAADDDVKARLREATDAAVARGVFGIPTFFAGAEMYFGKDKLGEIEAALAEAPGTG